MTQAPPNVIEHVQDLGLHSMAKFDWVIDARSPLEFAEDHVPGAVNLPVLDDEERALIGALYVQDDPFHARRVGAALVARNIARHLDGPLAGLSGGWRPLIYCWRGGQRSYAFATVVSQVGWRSAVLSGGYRTYRRSVVADLYELGRMPPVVLLGGGTGVGKTELLAELALGGSQVIDLEALAAHRGSLFGAFKSAPQPSQKLFESRLNAALAALDPGRPVLLEAESSKLGEIMLPPRLWRAMAGAPVIEVSATVEARVERLVRSYREIAHDETTFAAALDRLPRHIGRERRDAWRTLLGVGDLTSLARELLEAHYDPAYRRSVERAGRPLLGVIDTGEGSRSNLQASAARVREFLEKHHATAEHEARVRERVG